jgi:TolB-like protein
LFRDDAKQPNYIETVPRLGYRLVAPVGPWVDEAAALSATAFAGRDPDAARRMRVGLKTGLFAFGCAVLLLLASLPWNQQKTPARPDSATVPRSVGVLPFLDLTTQDMKEEYFADGITEELINKLSRVPGLKVPAPTASFYYKNKKVPIATIGRSLGVSYLLDGSIRESGSTMRVSARLVRSEDGYVLWSETYDRPANDRLRIQGDIATAVSKALSTAIN